ncbi:hypothetical protein L6470_07560 [Prevotella communis]|uniref:hypothetical protein n=1 Tax=Prevotella communis TaxID=2913614 RepID=UPI001EDBD820|nr:hypothetical protein [Prevotella communis]UKK58246.1 hypothetical protein L6470_07560 [Prevotella communis]
MKKNLFLMIVLLCAVVQGAWADGGWELVYRQTNTTSANWTALNAGSSTGYTIGTAGTTTYYYATGNLSFTNSTVGGSGLTIRGTVYLYIPSGKTVRCTGAKANNTGITGGGAGVELAAGNTLYLLGDGRLEATGGDGESGNSGGHGEDANFEYDKYCQPGSGGRGGDGGGGGGAGIGTRGGNGGAGGAGGSAKRDANEGTNKGVAGSPGSNGDTAGSMGTLYVYQGWNLSVVAKGGGAGWFTSAQSNRGKNAAEDPGNQYAASGGGGGGTSGNGSAGSDIGTGGGGGGGGGGGAAGNSTWRDNVYNGFYRVGAGGGKGGGNYDGSYASDGGSSELSNPYDAELKNGLVGTYTDSGWENGNGAAAGGSGGTCGAASKSGAAVTINVVLDNIFKGKGTESAPYIIGSIADWDVFALLVSNGISFNGLFVKLTSDISVSTMVGISETNSFQGTFLGDNKTLTFTKGSAESAFNEEYCAPFRYVKNAVIRNLRVTGDIYTARKFAAGLVARSYGETTFTDCHVTTAIHSSVGGEGTHGGFVALPEGNISFTGCVYTGRLLTTNGTNNCGGFVAWHNSKTFNFTHSLYAPDTTAPADGETTITAGCATFVRGGSPANGSTCYYTETMGTEQGSKVIVLASAPSNFGSMVQDYGTVKVYDNGLLVAGRYYVACDIAGTGIEGDPYTIGSTGDWNTLASYVGYGHTFSGQFVKLGGDISVETMVGTGDTNSFQGIFDGDNNTLTFNKGTEESPFAEDYCAPFRHVKNATIKNLHVAGTIYTSAKKAAGFVGESHGALTLTGCISSVNITSSIKGDGTHGGLVSTLSGENNTIIIEGCVFDGSFATTNGTNNCGGFIGWGVYNKPTIKNSLMKPGSVAAGMLNSTFARWYTGNKGIYEPTIDNCYYVSTDNLPTDQGTKAVYSARWSTGNLVQDYGMLKAYQNGILYGDIYYADADKASGGAGSGTEGDPYAIGSANEWNAFANYVSNGGSDFKGQFVKLTADISVSEMVGTSDHRFQGTFLGDGVHTLTFTKGSAQNAFDEPYCAPFRYTDGATIQNLKVAGDIYTAQKFAAGLIAQPGGPTTITNCHVSTVIHSSVSADGGDGTHGGFTAYPQGNVNFTGCVYTGRLFTTTGSTKCGGFVGWHNGKTYTFVNSLYAPDPNITAAANETAITTDCATFVRGGSAGTGCYYTETMGEAQGTQVYATIPENEICKAATICNTALYIMPVCTVSGIEESYSLNNNVEITPVVKYNETSLAFGTDYTATLDGQTVASFPVSPNKMGTYRLILNGAGDYAGSKSFYITLMPSSTEAVTMTDGDTYTIVQDCDVASATYRKTTDRVGKFHSWLVPFDYTIKAADLEKFTFYKINMIANSSDPSLEASDDIWVFVKRMSKDDVLRANMPYVYKPREAVTDYDFTTENTVLKAKNTGVIAKTETMEDIYNFYATYGNTSATAQDPFYYVNIYGELSYGDAVTVGAFRWIIRVESKYGSKPAYARTLHFFDGEEEETTGIISNENGKLRIDNSSDAWYTIDGVKLDGKPHAKGVYFQNGRKVIIK